VRRFGHPLKNDSRSYNVFLSPILRFALSVEHSLTVAWIDLNGVLHDFPTVTVAIECFHGYTSLQQLEMGDWESVITHTPGGRPLSSGRSYCSVWMPGPNTAPSKTSHATNSDNPFLQRSSDRGIVCNFCFIVTSLPHYWCKMTQQWTK
jgi:hypothetical protein